MNANQQNQQPQQPSLKDIVAAKVSTIMDAVYDLKGIISVMEEESQVQKNVIDRVTENWDDVQLKEFGLTRHKAPENVQQPAVAPVAPTESKAVKPSQKKE